MGGADASWTAFGVSGRKSSCKSAAPARGRTSRRRHVGGRRGGNMSLRIVLLALLTCLAAVARGQDKPDADRGSTAPDAPAKSPDAQEPAADEVDDKGGAPPAAAKPAEEKQNPPARSDRGSKAARSAAA